MSSQMRIGKKGINNLYKLELKSYDTKEKIFNKINKTLWLPFSGSLFKIGD